MEPNPYDPPKFEPLLMKYSLRSLMIVVTLAAIASGLVARSRCCAEQATFHRSQLPPEKSLRELRETRAFSMRMKMYTPFGERLIASEEAQFRFHEESALAYERVSKMPWLPISLPVAPSEPPE